MLRNATLAPQDGFPALNLVVLLHIPSLNMGGGFFLSGT